MSLKLALMGGVAVAAALLFSLLAYYHNKAQAQAVQISSLTDQRNEAQMLVTTQTHQLQEFNQISKAEIDEQKVVQQQSDARIVYIKTVAKASPCSIQPVPMAIVGRLREHADQIRQRAARSDSSQPAGGVSAPGN